MLRIEGKIANHDAVFDGAIEIDTTTGLIESVGPATGNSDIDTANCIIFPGFGDIHIHAREDVSGTQMYKEDFLTASAAAIHGGVVHVADMPNNPVAPIDDAAYTAKEHLTGKSATPCALQGVHGTIRRRSLLLVATRVGTSHSAVSWQERQLSLRRSDYPRSQ